LHSPLPAGARGRREEGEREGTSRSRTGAYREGERKAKLNRLFSAAIITRDGGGKREKEKGKREGKPLARLARDGLEGKKKAWNHGPPISI